jgi:hypothetical protein
VTFILLALLICLLGGLVAEILGRLTARRKRIEHEEMRHITGVRPWWGRGQ